MSQDPGRDTPSALLSPELPQTRIDAQWAAVATRLGARRAPAPVRARVAWLAAAAVVVAAALVVLVRSRSIGTTLEGTAIESAGPGQLLALPDGSEVRLAEATRVRVVTWTAARVVAELDRGSASFDVKHVDGRAWVVEAGAFDVRVVGTRFDVTLDGAGDAARISVHVERGRVEVARRADPKDVRVLGAGESWSANLGGEAAASDAPPSAAKPASAPATSVADEASARATAPPAPQPAPIGWEEHARAHQYKEAYDALGPDGFRAAVDRGGAEQLFRLAEVARASRHLRDAERAFDALRRKYRGDARAGLAAFELGRLRLDSLGNPAGAAEALADAIALSPAAPFREDAEARRVQALEASGARAACEKARDAYLARYPGGAHAAVVASRCGGSSPAGPAR
ncbi:MAG TPA: FecR family protein [Minicystis sp.]|nr:FecR family protein [Minicystis sp.]